MSDATSAAARRLTALLVGILAGLAAAAFHASVDASLAAIGRLAAAGADLPGARITVGTLVAAGLCGALVAGAAWLVRRFALEAAGSGIDQVEAALEEHGRPLRWRRIIPVKFTGGIAALAAGLVLGREGPTVQLGAALAAMLAHLRRLDAADTRMLLAAGAGAGLAAAFNAPLAGILFVCEEIDDTTLGNRAALETAVIATVTAVLISDAMFGQGPQLQAGPIAAPGGLALACMLPLGVLAGCLGRLVTAALVRAPALRPAALPRHLTLAAAVGAALAAIGATWPSAVFGGESLLLTLHPAQTGVVALAALLVVRFATFLASVACGTPGGLFAPLVSLGAVLGYGCATALESSVAPELANDTFAFALAGTAALLCATVQAPITAVALVAELTGAWAAMPGMLMAGITALLTARALGGAPIYQLLRQGRRPAVTATGAATTPAASPAQQGSG